MPFKIRTKLIVAFFAIIFPFIIIAGALVFYNAGTFRKASHKVETVSEERAAITNIILALERSLMSGNDYLITGDRKYIDDFYKASQEVEKRMKEAEGVVSGTEDMNMLGDTEVAWRNIKDISQKIFEIQNPKATVETQHAGSLLMEEMDYRWAYPAIERLKKWRGMHLEEYKRAADTSHKVWVRSWISMGILVVLLIISGVSFAVFYSNLFVKPIEALHNGADAIAGGDFKTRLDIKTGDELQQLSNAMNEMAEKLDGFYGTLEEQVREKTEELVESEALFRGIAEVAPEGIILMDNDGKIAYWSYGAEKIFGYAAIEAIGQELHLILAPVTYHAAYKKGFQQFRLTGQGPAVGKTLEFTALRKDGSEFPIAVSVAALRLQDKWHAVGILRDITERKVAEEALRETSSYLESLINYANAPIIVWNPAFRITRFNHAFEHFTGYKADEVIGKELGLLFPDASQKDSMDKIIRTSGGEFWDSVEIPILRKDGDIRISLWNSANIYENGKTLMATIAQGQDITERKKAEEELRLHSEIERNMAEAVYLIRVSDGVIVYTNPFFDRLFGYEPGELVGKNVSIVNAPGDKSAEAVAKEIISTLMRTGVWNGEVHNIKKDGTTFWCHANVLTFEHPQYGRVWLSMHQDITERKKAENKIKEQLDFLQRFEKVAVGREFRIKELRDRVEELEKKLKG